MPAQAVTAEVNFVNAAMDDWNFDATQIATALVPVSPEA